MIKQKHTVPSSVAEKIIGIYKKHKVADWGILKEKDEKSLDIPTTSVQFITCDGECVFSSETELPKKSDGIMEEIYNVLSPNVKAEAVKGEN